MGLFKSAKQTKNKNEVRSSSASENEFYIQGREAFESGDYTKAVDFYQQAAEQGLDKAQFDLGKCYQYGNGTEKNLTKALFWYEKAAEQGNITAQQQAGNLNLMKSNHSQAFYWYEKAAKAGDAFSQFSIANYYFNGQIKKKNLKKAKYWSELSAKQNNMFGQALLSSIYREEGNGEQYIFWLEKAAEQNEGTSQYNLALEYIKPKYLRFNFTKALYWMEKSKESGFSRAEEGLLALQKMKEESEEQRRLKEEEVTPNNLSYRADLGKEALIKGDYKEALRQLTWVTSHQHGEKVLYSEKGTYYMGCYYAIAGPKEDRDFEKAKYWFEIGVTMDSSFDLNNMFQLAMIYEKQENQEKCMYWNEKMLESGVWHGYYSMGMLYARGKFVKQDFQKAKSFLKKVAEADYVDVEKEYNLINQLLLNKVKYDKNIEQELEHLNWCMHEQWDKI